MASSVEQQLLGYLLGALDDVRVYNRVLSQEEILFVMGQTQPVAKPF